MPRNTVTFKTTHNNFIMTLMKQHYLYNPDNFNVAMKAYTYMLMYKHIAEAKALYKIHTKYDAVNIDFHFNTITQTHNTPVEKQFVVKCDLEDYMFNQTLVDLIYKANGTQQLIIKTIPMTYDIFNEHLEPYGFCSQNVTIDFSNTIFTDSDR